MAEINKAEPDSNSKKLQRGRAKGTRVSVQRPNVITPLVERLGLPGTILTYQDVANVLSVRTGMTITRAAIWRYVNKGLLPESPTLRRELGIPVTIAVAVCQACGQPPLAKRHRCTDVPPKPRRLTKNTRRKRLIHDKRWRGLFARMVKR